MKKSIPEIAKRAINRTDALPLPREPVEGRSGQGQMQEALRAPED
ncbi:MAG TPA: hypothetical protein VFZ91_09010 [Allosphingosinicella sp.]